MDTSSIPNAVEAGLTSAELPAVWAHPLLCYLIGALQQFSADEFERRTIKIKGAEANISWLLVTRTAKKLNAIIRDCFFNVYWHWMHARDHQFVLFSPHLFTPKGQGTSCTVWNVPCVDSSASDLLSKPTRNFRSFWYFPADLSSLFHVSIHSLHYMESMKP